jgi:hypothetical protein
MNDFENELRNKYSLPSLIFYRTPNPEYGKIFSMDDIDKPSEELYGYCVDDWMTLGRLIPDYERWATNYMIRELESKKRSATCTFNVMKHAVSSLEDIESFYEEEKSEIVFIDERLNEYFKNKNL